LFSITGTKVKSVTTPVNCENSQVGGFFSYFFRKSARILTTPGQFLRSFVTATPADLQSEEAQILHRQIQRFPEEAVYVYSFVSKRMVYANGWEEVMGYKDEEINLPVVLFSTCTEYAPFSVELNEKALLFILKKTEDLDKYSFTMELKKLHKDGTPIPMISKVGVFSAQDGKVTAIIGRFQVMRSLKFGKVMRYAAYGPEKSSFEEELNRQLFQHYAISDKEKEALSLVARGYSFKEIAQEFQVTPSAIEKRIIPMYKRFQVRSLTHLISFAYDNHILD
jgi:DNA-binding CsgD family transcriptional regulator